MASQVRPGSIEPWLLTGLQQSAVVIRHRPANSIRARGVALQIEAGCMGCNLPCDSEMQKNAWQRGASMYEWHDRDVNAARNILRAGSRCGTSVSGNESSPVECPPSQTSRLREAGSDAQRAAA